VLRHATTRDDHKSVEAGAPAPLVVTPASEDAGTRAAVGLFRPEVFVHQARRLDGEVLLYSGPPLRFSGYLIAAVLVFSLLFFSTMTYARTETVQGWLVPAGGLIRIAGQAGTTLDEVYVREGDSVRADQPIARLKLARETSGGDSGQLKIASAVDELEASRTGAVAVESKIRADENAFAAQRASLAAQLQRARDLLALLEKKRALARADLERFEQLKTQGFVSQSTLGKMSLAALDADQAVVTQNASIEALAQTIRDVEAKIGQTPMLLLQARSAAQAEAAALTQKLEQLRVDAEYTLSAPRAGTVLALPYTVGQTIVPDSSIAVLAPSGNALEAELFVPSRASGFVKIGQEVALQYQAYSYRTFGSAHARITSISRVTLSPKDLADAGLNPDEPVFRVRCRLLTAYVSAYGSKHELRPGASLTAVIVLDRRSLLEWIFDPLFAVSRRL
jgi:membrane fusion protein